MPPNPIENLRDAARQLGDQLRRTAGPELEDLLGLGPRATPPRPLAELQAELDGLVGLETVKEQVHALRRLPAGAGAPQGARPARGGDEPAPRLPRQPGHGQDDGGAAARRDVRRDGAAREGPPGRGRPRVARRPVRRPDRDQDRPGDPSRARRRPLHRRGLRADARRRRRPARLRRRGGRDAAEADGGPPPPPRRHRRRLPAADARLPRLEPRPALPLRPRDLVPRLLDGRSARDHAPAGGRARVRARAGRGRGARADLRRRGARRGVRQRALRAHDLRAGAQPAGAAAGTPGGSRAGTS